VFCTNLLTVYSSFILVGESNKFIEVKNNCSIVNSADEGQSINFENEVKLKKIDQPKYEKKIEDAISAKKIDIYGNLIDDLSGSDSEGEERIEAWDYHFDYDRQKMLRIRNWLNWKTVSPVEMTALLLRLTIRPTERLFQHLSESLNIDDAVEKALRAYLNDDPNWIHTIEYVTQMLIPKLLALQNLNVCRCVYSTTNSNYNKY